MQKMKIMIFGGNLLLSTSFGYYYTWIDTWQTLKELLQQLELNLWVTNKIHYVTDNFYVIFTAIDREVLTFLE